MMTSLTRAAAAAGATLFLAGSALAVRPAPAFTSPVSVPFTFDPIHEPFVVVTAAVNGHDAAAFVVDTGITVPLLLDKTAASGWGLTPLPGKADINGSVAASMASASTFSLLAADSTPAISVTDRQAMVSDQGALIANMPSIGIAGFIGTGGGGWPAYEIDYAARRLTLYPGSPFADGAQTMPFERADAGDVFTTMSPSGAPMRVLIDTGATHTTVSPSIVSGPDVAAAAVHLTGTVDALYLAADVVLPTFTIAGRAFHNVDVLATAVPQSRGVDVILGSDLLSHFDIRVDDSAKKICLTPADDLATLPEAGDYGFSIRSAGADLVVAGLRDGSAAATAGMQNGDILLTCNGKSLTGLTFAAARFVCAGLPGDKDTFTVRRVGDVQTIAYSLDPKPPARAAALAGVFAHRQNGQPFVVDSVLTNCPAAAAGLKAGDTIVSMDGVDTRGARPDQLLAPVNAASVDLVVKSPSDPSTRPLSIESQPASLTP